MRKLFAVLTLLVGTVLTALAHDIVPLPVQVYEGSGTFVFPKSPTVFCNVQGAERNALVGTIADMAPSHNVKPKKSAKAAIVLTLDNTVSANPEGYTLNVTTNGIVAKSPTAQGLYYALQTLNALRQADGKVPCVTVTDEPRFRYRGFMLDVSRHFFDKEFVKKQIRAMAALKLNRLHLHLVDAGGWRMEIKKYPELTQQTAFRTESDWDKWWVGKDRQYLPEGTPGAYGGYFTQDELREIVAYAKEHFITVVPEIEMPGHSDEVLTVYPRFSCTGKPHTQGEFCAGNDEVFSFIEDVLREVVDIFPSEYIHIGGDEAGKDAWKKCVKCQQRMKDEGLKDENELQSYFIRRAEKIVEKLGRKLLGWDEILEGGLAPNATVMSWRGEEGGLASARAGHDAIMTPGGYCYLDGYQDAPGTQPKAMGGYLTLEKCYSYKPVPESFTADEAAHIIGVQGNLWTEFVPTPEHCEYMIYPRLLAIAEVGWTPERLKDYSDFHRRALVNVEQLQQKGYHPFDLKNEVGTRQEYRQPIQHLALGKSVVYNIPYSDAYPANKTATLTDGLRGDWTYGDQRWQGFINRGRVDVTIDLQRPTEIHEVYAEFMQNPGPEVYLPGTIDILISDDGENFTPIHHEDYNATHEEPYGFHVYGWKGTATARYIRYKANCKAGLGGFQFVDEIVVK